MEKKESLYEIGNDIKSHCRKEVYEYIQNRAIARAFCHFSSSLLPDKNGYQTFWLVNREQTGDNKALQTDGQTVCKNTRMGEILIKYFSGKRKYTMANFNGVRNGKVNEVEIEIFNRAQYNLTHDSAKEITINLDGAVYRYQTLERLLDEKEAISERLDTLKRQQEATRKAFEAVEEERKRKKQEKEEAEKARLIAEELRKRSEEEKRQIEELRQKEAEAMERIAHSKAFLRQGAELRSQHILDCSQEDAKRSDLFNGVPVLIEGGPGTGKTTTMIQRLNFLLSYEALRDYENGLTDKQIEEITNPQSRDTKWLYFSPTKELLTYLRNNMANEGLHAGVNNSMIIDDFARHMLTAYKLNVPDQNGPFLKYRQCEGEECLIKEANVAIAGAPDKPCGGLCRC